MHFSNSAHYTHLSTKNKEKTCIIRAMEEISQNEPISDDGYPVLSARRLQLKNLTSKESGIQKPEKPIFPRQNLARKLILTRQPNSNEQPSIPNHTSQKCCLFNSSCNCLSHSDLDKIRAWVLSYKQIQGAETLNSTAPQDMFIRACKLFFKARGLENSGVEDKFCTKTFYENKEKLNSPAEQKTPKFFVQNWRANMLMAKYLQVVEKFYMEFLAIDDYTQRQIYMLTKLKGLVWSNLTWWYETLSIQAYRLFGDVNLLQTKNIGLFITMELYDLTEKDSQLLESLVKRIIGQQVKVQNNAGNSFFGLKDISQFVISLREEFNRAFGNHKKREDDMESMQNKIVQSSIEDNSNNSSDNDKNKNEDGSQNIDKEVTDNNKNHNSELNKQIEKQQKIQEQYQKSRVKNEDYQYKHQEKQQALEQK